MVEFSPSATVKLKPKIDKGKVDSKKAATTPCNVSMTKERLEQILENIPSAVVVFDKPDGRVVYANRRAIEIHGLNPCGLAIGKHPTELKIYGMNGKPCPTQELYTYRALFQEETFRDQPLIIERTDGRRFIVNLSAKPLYSKDGKVNGAVAIFDDVTERVQTQKALMESEERLRMAQKIAHVGSWEYIVDEDKAVWSDELFRIFGLAPSHYGPNRKEYLSLVHPDDREAMEQSMASRRGVAAEDSFDYRIIREDGSIRVIHTERRVREVAPDNRPIRVMGVEQDITERKQSEQKLAEHTKNLERLVAERTRQLKNAERLAAIGQTAGMIGHDIRNPLQAIAGELYLMKQEVDNSPDSQCKRDVQESLTSIQEQIDYMNKIIADLQDFARPLTPEWVEVDLCTAIPQMVATVNVPPNILTQAVCDSQLPKLKADATFLKRILVNLTTNAIQAMPDGGRLTIKATQQNGAITITVADTGVGIPDEVKSAVFQPLMTTKSKGQGFGLAVVKRLVEAQGGTIGFESKVGKGTKFHLTFPKQAE